MNNHIDNEWYKSLDPLQVRLYRQLYKKDFYEFVKEFWSECDPSKFIDGFVPKFFCEVFQFICRPWIGYDKPELKSTIPPVSDSIDIVDIRNSTKHNTSISVPPRHSKSQIFNVLGGVYSWINAPIKAASISHNQNLATKMNQKRQQLINSEKFKFFFPEIQLIQNTASSLIDSRGAEMYSINRDSATGFGYDLGLLDDLVSAETARKDKEEMNNAWQFFQNTMPSRINDMSKFAILNIAQRLSPADICGRILDDAKLSSQYDFITLPAIFEKETYIVCPISGDVYHFMPGDCLWPERFGTYEELRNQTGERVFQTQYLQKPLSSEDTIVKEEMIKEVDPTIISGWDINNNCINQQEVDTIYCSHDFPVKGGSKNDFLGSVTAYKIKKTLYIIDCIEERQDFVTSLQFIKNNELMYPSCVQIIETAANGNPLLNMLDGEVSNLRGYSPAGASKEERLSYATPYMISGNVVFVKTLWDQVSQKWVLSKHLQNLKQRLLAMPNVQHDDIVDAISMLINYVFNDIKYSVYGKAFNDYNIVDTNNESYDYSTVFFNKDGDTWKVLKIGIKYGLISKLIILKEKSFIANINDGLNLLHDFSPDDNVFIDCSTSEGLIGIYSDTTIIERYVPDDFDKSVTDLNYAFAQNKILVDQSCKLTQADIENFKFDKKNTNGFKYATNKDGFVACLRSAMKYYGGLS